MDGEEASILRKITIVFLFSLKHSNLQVHYFHPAKESNSNLEQKFNQFLWSGNDSVTARAKVAWGINLFTKERRRFGY